MPCPITEDNPLGLVKGDYCHYIIGDGGEMVFEEYGNKFHPNRPKTYETWSMNQTWMPTSTMFAGRLTSHEKPKFVGRVVRD